MRIRKRQVPLPLSSLLPVPLSDLYFNRLFSDHGGSAAAASLPVSDGLIKNKDDDDVDVKSCIDASLGSKNVIITQGESDSSIQVVEKNEKVVSNLRRRRSFRSFEEDEYEVEEEEEEEEASGGGGGRKGKKKAKKSGGTLEEGSRCSRVNGRGWRCCQQTLVGYSLCEHHLGKGRVRSMNKSRGGEKKAAAAAVAVTTGEVVKKKRVKLGMVKARSISSLLGQTSTSTVVDDNTAATEISAPVLDDK